MGKAFVIQNMIRNEKERFKTKKPRIIRGLDITWLISFFKEAEVMPGINPYFPREGSSGAKASRTKYSRSTSENSRSGFKHTIHF